MNSACHRVNHKYLLSLVWYLLNNNVRLLTILTTQNGKVKIQLLVITIKIIRLSYILFPFFLFLILSWLLTRMSLLIFISFFTMTITGAFYSIFWHCMRVFTVITEVSHFLFSFFSSLLYNSRQAGWKGLPLCSDIVEPCILLWHCSHIISYCTYHFNIA